MWPKPEVTPISGEHLRNEVDLIHETRRSPINRTPYWRFGVRSHARSATFADGGKQGSRIVFAEMAGVTHGFDLVSFDQTPYRVVNSPRTKPNETVCSACSRPLRSS
jgi:hypothetical protein